MTYRTPELQFVGIAQGVVLTAVSISQNECFGLDVFTSRDNPVF